MKNKIKARRHYYSTQDPTICRGDRANFIEKTCWHLYSLLAEWKKRDIGAVSHQVLCLFHYVSRDVIPNITNLVGTVQTNYYGTSVSQSTIPDELIRYVCLNQRLTSHMCKRVYKLNTSTGYRYLMNYYGTNLTNYYGTSVPQSTFNVTHVQASLQAQYKYWLQILTNYYGTSVPQSTFNVTHVQASLQAQYKYWLQILDELLRYLTNYYGTSVPQSTFNVTHVQASLQAQYKYWLQILDELLRYLTNYYGTSVSQSTFNVTHVQASLQAQYKYWLQILDELLRY
ncbi:hypothetical protein J6590_011203 [Homalodisca vitripennis]|nr:hypothetical protein J6590_011203 [Homalodisca vitripennis]